MRHILLTLLMGFAVLAIIPVMGSNVNTFKTGPFTVSVDLGRPCNDTNISKPITSEDIGGNKYTDYSVYMCQQNVRIWIRQWNKDATYSFDLTDHFDTESIKSAMLQEGADADTITLYSRIIDGKNGASGSGYVPKYDITQYIGDFYISAKSYCSVSVWGNETMAVSALKTIHITESAT